MTVIRDGASGTTGYQLRAANFAHLYSEQNGSALGLEFQMF